MRLSDTETTEIIHLARTLNDNINDVFMDFARPLMYFVQMMPDKLNEVIQVLLYAWNSVDEEGDLYQNQEVYKFIRPMIKKKKGDVRSVSVAHSGM